MGRQGIRSEWRDVPESVRTAVDALLGSPVVATRPVSGGFSPGPAVRADLDDGRTVFLKAAGTSLNPLAPQFHRREGAVLGLLPESVPAPRLLGVVDDGDWVVLAIEWIDGRMPSAPDPDDVRRLLGVLGRVAETSGADVPGIGSFGEVHHDLGGNWILLASEPDPGLDRWSRRHLERLAELDAQMVEATRGTHLQHVDVRTDNVLLSGAGPAGDVVVDWPFAAIGAPWIDLVALLPALHLDGGPPPAEVLAADPVASRADPVAIDVFVAVIAGFFTRQALLPPPPGLPTVREFQAAQGEIARRWAAERLRLA